MSKSLGPKKAGRIGTKTLDRRWKDASGKIWASKFESDVYDWIRKKGGTIRPCDKRDTVAYQTNVRQGVCGACSNTKVYQRHTYTPDLCVYNVWPSDIGQVFIEAKGFLRPKDRRILRAINASERKDARYALLLQREHAKSVEWAIKFLKDWHIGVWNNKTGGIRAL